jgi:hypothetical protein
VAYSELSILLNLHPHLLYIPIRPHKYRYNFPSGWDQEGSKTEETGGGWEREREND